MPTYRVESPDGRVLDLEGDVPPSETELDEIFSSLPPTSTASPVTSGPGLPASVAARAISRSATQPPPSFSAVEKLNSTISSPSPEEVAALSADPEWAAAEQALARPGFVQSFMSPQNTLNPLNLPTYFLQGAEKAAAVALNAPTRAARLLGLTPSTEEVFGATPQTQPIQLPFQAGVGREIIPEFEREKYSPVTRGVTDTLGGFTTPGNLATAPLILNKLIQALYLTQMVPGTYEAVKETVEPGKTPEERVESGTRAGLNAVLTTALGRGVAKQKPGIGEGVRPDAFEESMANMTVGDLADIRGRGVRSRYQGEVPIIGGEDAPVQPTFYQMREPTLVKPGYQASGEPKTGGEISFRGQGLPSARQRAVSSEAFGGQEQPPELIEQVSRVVTSKDRFELENLRNELQGGSPELPTPKMETMFVKQGKKMVLRPSAPEYAGAQQPGFGVSTGKGIGAQPVEVSRLVEARLKELETGEVNPELEAIRRTIKGEEKPLTKPEAGPRPLPVVTTGPSPGEKQLGGGGTGEKGIGASGREAIESGRQSQAGSISSDFLSPEFWTKEGLGFAKGVKVSGQQMWNRIRNKLGKESSAWKMLETNEEVRNAFAKGTMTMEEAKEVVREKGVRVEVRKFGQGEQTTEQREFAQLVHWADSSPELEWQVKGEGEESMQQVRVPKKGASAETLAKYNRFKELGEKDDVIAPNVEEAHWQSVSPKPESDMPGYVEIAVVKPIRAISETFDPKKHKGTGEAYSSGEEAQIKFPSSHSFPPNTIGWVRGYMETTKDGKKVFHVIEVQSDWAARQRENDAMWKKEGYKDEADAKAHGKITESMQDPLLPHWERLALKAAIEHAREQGADAIAVSDAETAMMTEGHDLQETALRIPVSDANVKLAKELELKGIPGYKALGLDVGDIPRSALMTLAKGQDQNNLAAELIRRGEVEEGQVSGNKVNWLNVATSTGERLRKLGFELSERMPFSQEGGMRLHYDQILPRLLEEMTGKKGERVEFGEHKMALKDVESEQYNTREEAEARAKEARRAAPNDLIKVVHSELYNTWNVNMATVRQNLIFRDPSGKPKTSISARTFPLKGVKKELSMVGKDKAETPVEQAVSKAEEQLGGQKGIGKNIRNVPSGSEEGAFSLLPVKQAAQTAGKVAKKAGEVPAMLIRNYAEPMIERLGRVGGPVAKKVTEEAHSIVKQGKYWYGQITPEVDKAKKAFGQGIPFTQAAKSASWVRELNEVNEGAAFNNFYGANEGAVTVPSETKGLIKTGDVANRAIGNLAVKANPDFKPTGKLQRVLNNFGLDIILRGGGEAWDNWVKGIAKVNKNDPAFMAAVAKSGKTPEQYIGDFFHRWKKELDAPGSDATTLDRIAQDFHRTMPRTITHVKSLGAWHEVIVADPFNYFESAAQRTAHAVAFREVYPLVRDPNTGKLKPSGYLQKTREAVMREVPTDVGQKEFDNLMRTLQGHPLDRFTGGATAPDTVVGMGYRMAREVALRPLKALMLSANAPVNLSEVVAGGPAIFLGLRNVTKGMVRLAKDKTLYTQLEQQGLVNRAMYNFANDPNSPVRSATRRLANATSKVTLQQALNELQEAEAAVTAKVAADRVRGKINLPLSERELGLMEQTIRAMGLSPERAAKAVRGKDEQALQIFESKAASWLTAGNQAMGEMSRFGVSRVFNELFWFHRYSQMVGNQFRAVGGNLIEDSGKWMKSPTKANWRPVRYNAELTGRMLAGRGFQGAATLGIMSAVTGGVAGLIAKKNEAEDAPFQFMADSLMQGVGGPLSILRRLAQNTHDSASLEQSLVELSPPAGIAGDFYDASFGVGRYEGRRPDERVAMFLESKSPGWKAVKTGMALFHIGDPGDQELEAATRAFYRWRNQQPGYPKGTEEQIDLRTQVKRVREKLLEGDDWQAELKKVTDVKYAADALRAGTLLEIAGKPLSAEQVKQLENRIGKRAVEKLRLRDAAVRELGRELGEAEKKDQPVMSIEKPTGKLARDYTTETQRREAVGALLSPETKKLLEASKMETPTYDPDIRPGRPVRELTREEAAVFNEEFAKQLDLRLAPLVKDPTFQSLPLPLRRKRLEDRAETARRRAQNITRGRLQQGTR